MIHDDHTEWLRVNLFDGPSWLTVPAGWAICATRPTGEPAARLEVRPIEVSYHIIWIGTLSRVTAEIDQNGYHFGYGATGSEAHANLIENLQGMRGVIRQGSK